MLPSLRRRPRWLASVLLVARANLSFQGTVLAVALVGQARGSGGFFSRDADEASLLGRIRERSSLPLGGNPPHHKHRRNSPWRTGRVSSAVPCDFFNRTERSCWIRCRRGTSRLLLRVSLEDEDLVGVAVSWKRKHKIRAQNLYAVEDIPAGSEVGVQRDVLSLELDPLLDQDQYLNKIQALVYLRRRPSDNGPGQLLYGELTYVIDTDPIVIQPSPGASEVVLSVEDYVELPAEGALIEWQRRLSPANFGKVPDNVHTLSRGHTAVVSLRGHKPRRSLTVACIVYHSDGRFLAMRSFSFASGGATNNAKSDNEKIDPPGERPGSVSGKTFMYERSLGTSERQASSSNLDDNYAVINLSVRIDKEDKDKSFEYDNGKESNDYTIVQTNVSVDNGNNKEPEQSQNRNRNRIQAAAMQTPKISASNVCFHLVRGDDGKTNVIPCSSQASTTETRGHPATPRGGRRRKLGKLDKQRRPSQRRPPKVKPYEDQRPREDRDGLQPCRAEQDCSLHASCVLRYASTKGHCVCDSGYLGNGLFCWERFLDD